MNIFLAAISSIVLSVAAQFLLKAGISSSEVKITLTQPLALKTAYTIFTNTHILGGLFLYGFGAVVWLGVLSQWDVSKAYPLVGLGFIFTLIVGLLMGEQVSAMRAIGAMLIFIGVLLVGRS